tara:strand:- start:31 stop:522 length:492 start_codon:yes stop_codon:yes gene_type:complete
MLTQERLKELFHYDPYTGVFTRLVRISRNTKVGDIAGRLRNSKGYHYIRLDGKFYYTHRLAWLYMIGEFPSGQIDHINGNKDDNRFTNLRDVSQSTNMQNLRKPRSGNTSGFLGVSWNQQSCNWRAQIRICGKKKYLGGFPTAELAYEAYLTAKRLHHNGCTI